MPDWQKEWIANKGIFVLLKCGCTEDLNPLYLPLVRQMLNGYLEVWCDRHDGFFKVTKKSTAGRLAGIKLTRVPDTPLF